MRRRTLATLGILLACLAALLVPARATAAEPDWGNLPYVYYDGTGYYFDVFSNAETWQAYRVINVPGGLSQAYPTPEVYAGKVTEAIWAKACSATKKQKVTISRDVQLPGTPGELLLDVQRRSLHGTNPISSVEVRLNNTRIATLKGRTDGVNAWKSIDVSAYKDTVRYGTNTLTLIAVKAKTKKADGFCVGGTPDFGVAVELVGRPVSDMQVTLDELLSSTIGLLTHATVTNAGPSVAAFPTFSLTTGHETGPVNVTELHLYLGDAECPASSTGEGMTSTCQLPALAPGEAVQVTVIIKWAFTCPSNASVAWGYNSFNLWQDTDRSNNGRGDRLSYCPPA